MSFSFFQSSSRWAMVARLDNSIEVIMYFECTLSARWPSDRNRSLGKRVWLHFGSSRSPAEERFSDPLDAWNRSQTCLEVRCGSLGFWNGLIGVTKSSFLARILPRPDKDLIETTMPFKWYRGLIGYDSLCFQEGFRLARSKMQISARISARRYNGRRNR